jgi:hypothetical protein
MILRIRCFTFLVNLQFDANLNIIVILISREYLIVIIIIQVLRPYVSLWAYDRCASDEIMYKLLSYIHKNMRKKHIKGSFDGCRLTFISFFDAVAYLISPIVFQNQRGLWGLPPPEP